MFTDIRIESKTGVEINFKEAVKFIVINKAFEILDYDIVDVDTEQGLKGNITIKGNDTETIRNAEKCYVEIEEQLKEVSFIRVCTDIYS